MLLRITESYKLEAILNNIRRNIESKNITNVRNITCSIGATIYQPNDTILNTIKSADINLYKAKENGRNQVILTI